MIIQGTETMPERLLMGETGQVNALRDVLTYDIILSRVGEP